ncbi:MAG: hypothetical protein H6613_01675 [Ignavibacteriales bacterium]|nr:hypothetical protein [Ignavibacteriales bacterium]
MRLKRLIIFIFFLFHSQYFFQPAENFTTFNVDSNQSIKKKYVEVLGSDLFEGRGTGSKGGELSANYIASIYRRIGLVPLNNDSSFFPTYSLTWYKLFKRI